MADTAFSAREAGGFASACMLSIRRTFVEHLPLYACSIAFCICALLIATVYRVPVSIAPSVGFLQAVPLFAVLGISLNAALQLARLVRLGARDPLRAMARWLRDGFLAADRPGNIFHAILTLTPLMIAFDALKEQIPRIHPFAWDGIFTQWDRVLGMGRLPWQILQPVLGHPPVTAGINFIYDLWFVVMFGCLFWQAFTARGGVLRLQFLLAFSFAWFIGGNLLATYFSSAGPCFFGHLHPGPDPYGPLVAYLRETNRNWPVWSVHIQDMLWQSYENGGGMVSGISAMPSMHVTIATLLALLGMRTNKWLGTALVAFAALIVVGSIVLAWHYAVDSIAGVALALLFWKMAGLVARRVPYGPGRAAGLAPGAARPVPADPQTAAAQ